MGRTALCPLDLHGWRMTPSWEKGEMPNTPGSVALVDSEGGVNAAGGVEGGGDV